MNSNEIKQKRQVLDLLASGKIQEAKNLHHKISDGEGVTIMFYHLTGKADEIYKSVERNTSLPSCTLSLTDDNESVIIKIKGQEETIPINEFKKYLIDTYGIPYLREPTTVIEFEGLGGPKKLKGL